MDTTALLNEIAYPSIGDNARRKVTQYYDTITMATGQNEYSAFNSNLGNVFLRNKKFPLSGNEIFAITNIGLYLKGTEVISYANLIALLGQSYLEIYVNSRQQIKIPLIECLSFNLDRLLGNDSKPFAVDPVHRVKNLVVPIIINSTSNVQVNLFIATAGIINTRNIQVQFYGVQTDKLDTFFYDDLGNNQLQDIAYTLYDTVLIDTANEKTFQLFKDGSKAKNLFSKTLDLSNIERFDVQNIEVFFPGLAAGENFITMKDARMPNILNVNIEDVQYYNSNMFDVLSLISLQSGTFSDAGPVNTNYSNTQIEYNSKTLEKPIIFPANGNVSVSLQQPAASPNLNNYFTCMLKGVMKRRVA